MSIVGLRPALSIYLFIINPYKVHTCVKYAYVTISTSTLIRDTICHRPLLGGNKSIFSYVRFWKSYVNIDPQQPQCGMWYLLCIVHNLYLELGYAAMITLKHYNWDPHTLYRVSAYVYQSSGMQGCSEMSGSIAN